MIKIPIAKKNKLFINILKLTGYVAIAILVLFLITLIFNSFLSIKTLSLQFLFNTNWQPNTKNFGAAPFIIGTLLTSVLALMISIPFSLSISIYIGYFLKNKKRKNTLETLMDLLAGIPSVIYGFWGLMVLVPVIIKIQAWLGIIPYGVGILAASLILALMIIPYSVTLGKDIINLVPNDLVEAAIGLGATPYEVIKHIAIPYSLSGLFAGHLMAFGRAISETMAVTMVIGNRNFIPTSIMDPANTLASVIANEFGEASDPLYVSSLIELGLILLVITTIINIIGKLIVKAYTIEPR
ncbi:phosphate ABC transporter permease subunit PstC [bacterium]|nr:phosphate ABC transporter permease subunit PstC [bacterium]